MDVDGELLRVERDRTRVQAEEISRLRLENAQLRAQVGALNQHLMSVRSWMAHMGQHYPPAVRQQQPAWASIAQKPSSSTMMSGPMPRPMPAAAKAVSRRPSGSSTASTKELDLDPFSALYAAAAAGSRPEVEDDKASVDTATEQPAALVEPTVVECPPTTDDLLFLSGGSTLQPSPALSPVPSPAPPVTLQPASTFELFDGGGDDEFDEEDDDDIFNPPPPQSSLEAAPPEASEQAPAKQQTAKEDDDEARRARKSERRRKKEDREKKLERRRKRAEERRVADERAASRDPNAYSSYYSRGSLEASNDKWRGIGSNDVRVAEIDSVRGFGSGKYRGFGNPYFEQDTQDDEQGAIAKVGGAALDLLSSAKDLVISNFAKSSSHSEITGPALRTYS